MSKLNGLTWTVIAPIVAFVIAAAIGGCWAYARSAANRANDNAIHISAGEARADGMREDIRDIKTEQRAQGKKLDDILARLPR